MEGIPFKKRPVEGATVSPVTVNATQTVSCILILLIFKVIQVNVGRETTRVATEEGETSLPVTENINQIVSGIFNSSEILGNTNRKKSRNKT
jgi:hypothetical protein